MSERTQNTARLLLVIALVVACAHASAIARDLPLLHESYAFTNATEPVALYTLPSGDGRSFTEAQPYEGYPDHDATVTLVLLNALEEPIPNWPYEDLWLESEYGGLILACFQATAADANTDENGVTHWQQPLRASGYNEPSEELIVMISGSPLEQLGFEIHVNSPDIDGDGCVFLPDVVLFAEAFLDATGYTFSTDFWWDGSINISDLTLFAQGYGACCP